MYLFLCGYAHTGVDVDRGQRHLILLQLELEPVETKLNPLREQKTLVTSERSLPQESAFCCRYETSQCLCVLGLFLIEEEEVSYTRRPKAVMVFPSALIRMNDDSLRWSVCQLEKTWLLSGSDKPLFWLLGG